MQDMKYREFIAQLPAILEAEFGDQIQIDRMEETFRYVRKFGKNVINHKIFFVGADGYIDGNETFQEYRITGDIEEALMDSGGCTIWKNVDKIIHEKP